MCLGLVCELLELRPDGTALVSHDGRTIEISLLTLGGGAEPGDWLLVHSGFALVRLTRDEALQARTARGQPPPPPVMLLS
ncbi:MAG TPA: HypC/HybG/HupF family hydrogenase formation chaperone [Jiangellales bacterium]|nr:HypC/HybG/HupF family hydrogenase formation chaperone [Jiangellales bacterium]